MIGCCWTSAVAPLSSARVCFEAHPLLYCKTQTQIKLSWCYWLEGNLYYVYFINTIYTIRKTTRKKRLLWEPVCVIGVSFLRITFSLHLFLLFVILLFSPLFMPLSYYLCCCHIFLLTHSHPLSKPLKTQIKGKMQSLYFFLLFDPF